MRVSIVLLGIGFAIWCLFVYRVLATAGVL